jgi:hypothetical protein
MLVVGELARLDLEVDGAVCLAMAEAAPPSTEISPQVSPEETENAFLPPLAHVDELVGEQLPVVLAAAPEEDEAAQGHPTRARGQERDNGDTSPVAIHLGHVDVSRALFVGERAHTPTA